MDESLLKIMSSTQPIDNVIINLKVLSAIKPGDRVTMSESCFNIQESGFLQPIKRMYNGDTRWVNLSDIQKIIDDAIRLLGTYVSYLATQRESNNAYRKPPVPKRNMWLRQRRMGNNKPDEQIVELNSDETDSDDSSGSSNLSSSTYVQPNEETCVAQIKALGEELSGCNEGLENLKQTYEHDTKMSANIDVLVQKIAMEISKATKILKAYTED